MNQQNSFDGKQDQFELKEGTLYSSQKKSHHIALRNDFHTLKI